ncbi:hypothetical protein B0H16DRAFT_54119 [Mycena metata]|uniref:Uncharacterized protein n=1 Tax=Mycena metata TaxID=1033252 RepID=A0AAD7N0J2_9AGAR|nr:hypothetical protein B0H16DRAFT_54119 [Mycena metata]
MSKHVYLEISLPLPTMNVDPPPAVPHPCDQNPNPKSLVKPETTFSVRHIKMSVLSIDANYPYTLSPIEGIFPNKGDSYAFIPVPYFEFCGLGAPPADVGTPGDVYIDTTPGAQALYSKSEEDWTRWVCPASGLPSAHPHFSDLRSPRFLWFHPEVGVEWVCRQTVRRRQESLPVRASDQANLNLASEIIGRYLAAEAAPGLRGGSQLPASEEEEEDELSELSDVEFYPSKRARRIASGTGASISVPIPPRRAYASRSKAPLPSSPPAHSTPDSTTLALERELAALKRDPDLKLLRNRKQELLATLATRRATVNTLSPAILQTLAEEFNKSCPSTLTRAYAPILSLPP